MRLGLFETHSLRSTGNSAQVGSLPGVTRSLRGILVSDKPPLMLVDSPGVLVPSFEHFDPETAPPVEHLDSNPLLQALKLSLCACVSEKQVDQQSLLSYVHWLLVQNVLKWPALKRPVPETCDELIELVATEVLHLSLTSQLHVQHVDRAKSHIVKEFRAGHMGRSCLDDVQAAIRTLTKPSQALFTIDPSKIPS